VYCILKYKNLKFKVYIIIKNFQFFFCFNHHPPPKGVPSPLERENKKGSPLFVPFLAKGEGRRTNPAVPKGLGKRRKIRLSPLLAFGDSPSLPLAGSSLWEGDYELKKKGI